MSRVKTARSEEEQTLGWCMEQFLRLGFTEEQAGVLAERDASWHEAHDLIEQGCPHEIAFDILS